MVVRVEVCSRNYSARIGRHSNSIHSSSSTHSSTMLNLDMVRRVVVMVATEAVVTAMADGQYPS